MLKTSAQKLIFVYNADSGIRNTILDSAHKIFRPRTYQCSLCDITHGAFYEKSAWKEFKKKSNIKMEFLHKDEFVSRYSSKFRYKFSFPIALAESNYGLEVLIKTEELNVLTNIDELIELITTRSL